MGAMFGKMPKAEYIPPPTPSDPAVEAARAAELRRDRALRGAASTLLTPTAAGDTSKASVASKVLLGT